MRAIALPSLLWLGLLPSLRAGWDPPPLSSSPAEGERALPRTPSGAAAPWRPMAGSLPALRARAGEEEIWRLRCNFARTSHERASWDADLSSALAGCRALAFWCASPNAAPVSHFTLYLRSEGGWYAFPFSPPAGGQWGRVLLEEGGGRVEGDPAGWGRVDGVRISAWRGADLDTEFCVAAFARVGCDAPVIVVRPSARAAAGASGRAGGDGPRRVAADLQGWLRGAGIDAVGVDETDLGPHVLSGRRVVFLPENPRLPEAASRELERFLSAGGRVVAFYNLPDSLAVAMGLDKGRWVRRRTPGEFASIRGEPSVKGWSGVKVEQDSWNLQLAAPAKGRGRVLARWHDSTGNASGRPAIVATDRGAFVTHILLRGDPEPREDLLLALVGELDRELALASLERAIDRIGAFRPFGALAEARRAIEARGRERGRDRSTSPASLSAVDEAIVGARRDAEAGDYPAAAARVRAARRDLLSLWCALQEPVAPEFRAFWCHSAFGVEGKSWDEAIELLARSGFNAILPNLLWGGVAYYRSEVLPVAPEVAERGDQLALCLAACRRHRVACHVWKVSWNLGWKTPRELVERLRRQGRLQVRRDGSLQERWLCPSHPANRRLEIDSLLEVVREYPVDGIHFDYIRYPGPETCFCPECRGRFERELGRRVSDWPEGIFRDDATRRRWLEFRRERISSVVEEVARQARRIRPGVKISAAVFRNWPMDRDRVGQDWARWCERGWLDFVCPMDYGEEAGPFERSVKAQLEEAAGVPCYPGIGLSTWRDGADIARLIEQIGITRRLATGGFTVFQYGALQARSVLPACQAGITRPAPAH